MKKQTQEQFLKTIDRLLEKLAEREAEIYKLRKVLSILEFGLNPEVMRTEAHEALSTQPGTSYLEQWEKNRYQVVGYFGYEKVHGLDVRSFSGHQCKLHNALLYARKD